MYQRTTIQQYRPTHLQIEKHIRHPPHPPPYTNTLSNQLRLTFLVDLLAKRRRHVMLVGTAGTGTLAAWGCLSLWGCCVMGTIIIHLALPSFHQPQAHTLTHSYTHTHVYGHTHVNCAGKTSIISEYLRGLDKDADKLLCVRLTRFIQLCTCVSDGVLIIYIHTNIQTTPSPNTNVSIHTLHHTRPTTINMSYYTDSGTLQREIELAIDKRSGRKFGPPQVCVRTCM